MYALQNRVQLIGNLGDQPEIHTTESGKKLARFQLATDEVYRNSNGDRIKETQWHSVIAWGKMADVAEKYLDKGSQIVIEGKLVSRSYIDKEGIKKYSTEVQVNELLMLGHRSPK